MSVSVNRSSRLSRPALCPAPLRDCDGGPVAAAARLETASREMVPTGHSLPLETHRRDYRDAEWGVLGRHRDDDDD